MWQLKLAIRVWTAARYNIVVLVARVISQSVCLIAIAARIRLVQVDCVGATRVQSHDTFAY